jgi:hypothetical protein
MIKNIVELLKLQDYYDAGYNVQVAKGLYSYEKGVKEIYKQEKRMRLLKKNNKEAIKKVKELW